MDSETTEVLNLNYRDLRSLVENLEKQIRRLEYKATRLAGTFAIFCSIMYIQVFLPSAAAALGGRKRWIPPSLAASSSVAFWLTFITTVNDSLRLRRQQDCSFIEQERLYRKIYSIKTGKDCGSAAAQESLTKAFAVARYKRYVYVGVVHSALFCFTLLVLYALSSI